MITMQPTKPPEASLISPPALQAEVGPLPSLPMEAKIRSEGLRAWFGQNEVLKGISMPIPERQVTAIIGPSGCGKSTFIRCVNRMHEVVPGARAEGKVTLDGQDVYAQGVNPVRLRQRVGMVFQKPNPFPTMTIRDNVLAGLMLQGQKPKNADEIVEQALIKAALWNEVKDSLNRPGVGLSGGQQQRLCIARTLALEPEVVLMDEPCSALDPIATAKIEELIHDLKAHYTVAIVTHNMQQAARVADFTAFFYLGELIEFNETSKVFTRPDKQATEDYITGRFG